MKQLSAFGLSAALCILIVELALRFVDPFGLHYFADLRRFDKDTQEGVYLNRPGEYKVADFSATILDDRTRDVPSSQPADCTLVFIGDSVTFGHGVGDDQTFVNLIAAQLPDVQVVNAGQPGHNIDMLIYDAKQYPDADLLIYTVTENDRLTSSRGNSWQAKSDEPHLMLYSRYAWYRFVAHPKPDYDDVLFISGVAALLQDPRLYIIDYNQIVPDGERVIQTTWDYDAISFADGHPDAPSHRRFAETMTPIIRSFIEDHCG